MESRSGRRWTRRALVALASLYLGGLWLDGIGSSIPERVVPRPLLFFLQAASLFTQAGTASIDYRAEAWSCQERRWVEMDVRPHFQINHEDKENRFHRTLHFYRRNRPTLQALERYLMEAHAPPPIDDGIAAGPQIGGVRFSSVRGAIPEPGQPVTRWRRVALADVPEQELRRWYWTPQSKRAERCGQAVPPEEDA